MKDKIEKDCHRVSSCEAISDSFEHEICERLTDYLLDEYEKERHEFADNPDMLYKLNVHFPAVYDVAKKIAPDDEVIQLAALYHDYGRVIQFRKNGDFNDRGAGSSEDHHVLGYEKFLLDAPRIIEDDERIPLLAIQESVKSGVIHKVSKAILLHGLRGIVFNEEFAKLDNEAKNVVDVISQIDDIANGTQCVGYLLRESQEHSKNVSRGGFIPDENEDLKTVSPKVMECFRKCIDFDYYRDCKTYADYCISGAFLAIRNLKNPATHDITREMMSQPTTVAQYLNIDGEDVLVSKQFDSAMEAFKYVFFNQLEEADAREAYSIMLKYYNG